MTIRDMRDIEREQDEEAREQFKEKVIDDVDDIRARVLKRFRESDKKDRSRFSAILRIGWIIGLGLLVINFVLANLWLIKFFIKQFIFKF